MFGKVTHPTCEYDHRVYTLRRPHLRSLSSNVLFGDVLRGDGKINEFDPLVVAVGRGAFADLPKCAAGLLGLAAVCRGGGAEQGGARCVEARG